VEWAQAICATSIDSSFPLWRVDRLDAFIQASRRRPTMRQHAYDAKYVMPDGSPRSFTVWAFNKSDASAAAFPLFIEVVGFRRRPDGQGVGRRGPHLVTQDVRCRPTMQIIVIPNEKGTPAGKLADAELH
jgi:hypothetical protein